MASLPRIRSNIQPWAVDNNGSKVLYMYDVAALIWSQNHRRLRGGSWDGGGEFLQARQSVDHALNFYDWLRNGNRWKGLAGGVNPLASALPPNVNTIVGNFGTMSQWRESARADFTTGWNKTAPGRPEASLAQFLVELRDFPLVPGFQTLKQSLGRAPRRKIGRYRTSFFKDWVSGPIESIPRKLQIQVGFFRSLGSEYLNWQFGWVPFVSDLEKLYVLSQTIDNRIRQIARDNGRGVRRRAETGFDQTTDYQEQAFPVSSFGGVNNAPPNWASPASSRWSVTTVTTRRSWYSARYRYYIPDVGSGSWIPKARRILYGAQITPALLWELTPWSWMIDWFLNVGDVISNFSENAVDNLVADYAFSMINTKVTQTAVSTGSWSKVGPISGPIPSNIAGGNHNLTSVMRKEIKVRVRGTPYGLGVKWGSLTDHQLGILAALGISQGMFLD